MKRIKFLLSIFVLAGLGTALAIDGSEDMTVLQGLQAAPEQFSTFLSELDNAGLTDALQGTDPVTVLAPTNDAFENLDPAVFDSLRSDPDAMTAVLKGLILQGAYKMIDLKDAEPASLVSLSGDPLDAEVTAGGLKVNGVGFAPTDVDNVFSNGIVQVTDRVLLPASLRTDTATAAQVPNATEQPSATQPNTTEQPSATEPSTTEETAPAPVPAPGAAQTAPAPVPVPVVPAPGSTPNTAPVADQPEATTAFVRVAQLAPNATLDLVMTPEEASGETVDLSGLEYGHATDYQEVQPGKYQVTATLSGSDASLFDALSAGFDAGHYYTIAVRGLQIPSDEAPSTKADGFVGWVQGLFGNDQSNRDALAFTVNAYQDEIRTDATDHRVRIIDAAPGSPAFDVVVVDAQGDSSVLVGSMNYGDDSGMKGLPDDATSIQVNAAGSSAVVLDTFGPMPLPNDATVFLIGTTFEGAPYQALVLQNGGAGLAKTNP